MPGPPGIDVMCLELGVAPSAASLMVAVGILGKYVGMLNVAADTPGFPNSGPYSWGHVVVLTRGRMQRGSFSDLLKKIASVRPKD